jgi:hypothetical protein
MLAVDVRRSSKKRGSSSVGRASAFQAERRRFEPGLPLEGEGLTQVFQSHPSGPPSSVVEHFLGKEEVTGSSPVVGSNR